MTSSDPTIASMEDRLGNKIWVTDLTKEKELSLDDVRELVQKVTDDDVAGTIRQVESITSDKISRMEFSIFEFVGFDPKIVVKVLRAFQSHYKDTNENLLSDIRFSIAAVIYMGNVQQKSFSRRALQGQTKINYLAQKYGIRTGTQGAGLPAEALTFPRICAAFPVLAVRMAVEMPPNAVSIAFQGSSVPACMRLVPFCSLLGQQLEDDIRIFLMKATNAYSADMALAYDRGAAKKQKRESKLKPTEAASDQWSFIEIAANSAVPDDASKKSMLAELNLTRYYEKIAAVVEQYDLVMAGLSAPLSSPMSKDRFSKGISAYISSVDQP